MLPIIGYLAWPRPQAKPIDLLAEINVNRDGLAGDWQLQRKELFSPDEPYARLALRHPAPAAYKLEVTARRISGGRLVLGLVRDGRQLPIVINTTTVGGGRDAEEASHRDLAAKVGFTGGPASTYTAIVHPQGTLVAFEDRVLQAYGPGDTPGGADAWRTGGNTLFVGTHNSVYHFTHIALTPLHR